jgi:valyl-tRNA synthetase
LLGLIGQNFFFFIDDVIDVEKEKIRIQKEIDTVAPYVLIQEKKLKNEQFVANAPAAVVDIERKKLAEAKEKLSKLHEQLASLT